MPRMPKKRKLELSFFLNERGRVTYNGLCRKCQRTCKQSLPPGSTLRCKLFRSASLKFIHKFSVDTQPECEYNVLVHTVHFKVKAVKHGNHNQQ